MAQATLGNCLQIVAHLCLFLRGELTAFCKWSLALSMYTEKASMLIHSHKQYQSMGSLDHSDTSKLGRDSKHEQRWKSQPSISIGKSIGSQKHPQILAPSVSCQSMVYCSCTHGSMVSYSSGDLALDVFHYRCHLENGF